MIQRRKGRVSSLIPSKRFLPALVHVSRVRAGRMARAEPGFKGNAVLVNSS